MEEGIDPAEQRRAEKAANQTTFGDLASEYFDNKYLLVTALKTQTKILWLLRLLKPLEERPIASITPRELLTALRSIEAVKSRNETTHRAKQLAGRVFRYAQQLGHITSNPADALDGDVLQPVKVEHHAAITDPVKVGALLRAIAGYDGRGPLGLALCLLPLTFVRSIELRGAHWSEFDLDSAVWRVPAERMKMKRPHIVPLSTQAIAILRQARALTGSGELAFPTTVGSSRILSDNAFGSALRRLGYMPHEQTAHGFRTIASTLLHELGHSAKVIELQLAHAEPNKVAGAYNRAEQLPARTRLMQEWADYLDKLKATKPKRASN